MKPVAFFIAIAGAFAAGASTVMLLAPEPPAPAYVELLDGGELHHARLHGAALRLTGKNVWVDCVTDMDVVLECPPFQPPAR